MDDDKERNMEVVYEDIRNMGRSSVLRAKGSSNDSKEGKKK